MKSFPVSTYTLQGTRALFLSLILLTTRIVSHLSKSHQTSLSLSFRGDGNLFVVDQLHSLVQQVSQEFEVLRLSFDRMGKEHGCLLFSKDVLYVHRWMRSLDAGEGDAVEWVR